MRRGAAPTPDRPVRVRDRAHNKATPAPAPHPPERRSGSARSRRPRAVRAPSARRPCVRRPCADRRAPPARHAAAMAFRLTARLLQQHGAIIKKSTGLTGLDVVPNAREVLVKLYEKTLKDIQASMAVRCVCAPRAAGARSWRGGVGGAGEGACGTGARSCANPRARTRRALATRARSCAPSAPAAALLTPPEPAPRRPALCRSSLRRCPIEKRSRRSRSFA